MKDFCKYESFGIIFNPCLEMFRMNKAKRSYFGYNSQLNEMTFLLIRNDGLGMIMILKASVSFLRFKALVLRPKVLVLGFKVLALVLRFQGRAVYLQFDSFIFTLKLHSSLASLLGRGPGAGGHAWAHIWP